METNSKGRIIAFAQSIIESEIAALQNLTSGIGDAFVEVVEQILNLKGRVVISGIGKSAIIGSKIVATLNSTGTPSAFMHAADAIHGDLGMVQSGDLVIVISKSGNTPEIKTLVPMIRNLGGDITIVAMVGNPSSFLALASDKVLACDVDREACPLNLAPTSSTTAQLVMGDALAMSLLSFRGFSSNDFAKFHPGGALGKRLYTKVAELIHPDQVPQVDINAPIDEVIFEISSKRVGATAVLDHENRLVGIITDGDLRRMLQRKIDISLISAKDIMSSNPRTIDSEQLAIKAFEKMEENKITSLLVVNSSGRYCGLVHIHDILRQGVV